MTGVFYESSFSRMSAKNNNKFVNLELQNSINNINDKIYLFKNFVIYLDEGEYLYTYDLLTKDFLLYNYVPDVAVCYRCSVELRGFRGMENLNLFDHHTAELYQYSKMENL